MLSYTCKTAIKAVIYLTNTSAADKRVGIKEVALQIDASEHTVGKILQTLAKHGIINSVKGPYGGFFVSDKQQQQPIINIVEIIEGHEVFSKCGLGLSKCSAAHPCPIHYEYQIARDLIEKLFKEKRVIELCDPVKNGIAYLVG